MVKALHRWFCGLRGHDAVLHFEDRRMSLQCTSCGYETPGLTTGPPADAAPKVLPFPVILSRGERRKIVA